MFKKGFSLPELIIIMAIIGIMTSVGLVFLGDGRRSEKLEGSSRVVANAIQTAQNNALTGRQMGNPANDTICGYGIRAISAGDASYVPFYNRVDAGESCDTLTEHRSGSASVNVYASPVILDDIVTFSQNYGDIYFSMPHAIMYIDGVEGSSGSLVLTNGDISHTICIDGSGNVTENGENNSC